MGGYMIKGCFGSGKLSSDEEEAGSSDQEEDLHHTEFIMMLADQAGVVAAHGRKHLKSSGAVHDAMVHLYTPFMEMWLKRANDWKGQAVEARQGGYSLNCDLSVLRKAFALIDTGGDGKISGLELSAVLKAMGTRATAGELENMVYEIDADHNNTISFEEFTLFVIFK